MGARRGVTEFLRAFEDIGTTFFDIETDLLLVLDEQGNIRRTNPAFTRVTGYTEAEALGKGLFRFVCVDDWAVFLRSFTSPSPAIVRILHKESGMIRVQLIAYRFKSSQGYLAFRPMREVR